MKIVNIILTSQLGGAETVFLDYIRVFQKLGHENLAILKDDAPYVSEVKKLGIEVKQTSNNYGFYDLIAVNNIKKIIQNFEADLVVCHMGRSMVLARKAINSLKEKQIMQISVNHSDNVKRSIGSDVVISINKEIFFNTIESGQSEDKSFVVPNAIDISDVDEKIEKINLEKQKEITIGLIGRFDRTKGFDYVIKSILLMDKRNEEKTIKLKIAGDGYFKKDLEKIVVEEGLEDRIEFCGWVEHKKEFFDSIDIFVLPSLNEPFGLVLLEAMKYHKPIITTDCDGPKEILIDKKEAIFVPRDPLRHIPVKIADAITSLIKDKKLSNDIVKNAHDRLIKNYSYDALEARLKEIVGEAKE